jgi:hypothetical protein
MDAKPSQHVNQSIKKLKLYQAILFRLQAQVLFRAHNIAFHVIAQFVLSFDSCGVSYNNIPKYTISKYGFHKRFDTDA